MIAVQSWNVCVELNLLASSLVDDKLVGLHTTLEASSPAISASPNGNLTVRIFTEADTVMEALRRALRTVMEACWTLGIPQAVVGISIMTEEEFDRRLAE